MDYERLLRIAERLEAAVDADEELAKEIDVRVEKEKQENPPPEQCLEASDEDSAEEAKEVIASRRDALAELAAKVEKSAISEDRKRELMARIRAASGDDAVNSSEDGGRTADQLGVKRSDLAKPMNSEMTKIMKQTGKLNRMVQEVRREGMTLKEMVEEMKEWGDANDVQVDFPNALLSKTLGSCNAAWIIELGPMVASLIKKYEEMKQEMLEQEAQEQ